MDFKPHLWWEVIRKTVEGVLLPALEPLDALPLGLLLRKAEALLFLNCGLLVGHFLFALPEPILSLLKLSLQLTLLEQVLGDGHVLGAGYNFLGRLGQ
jgi:hypothetical protein